MIEPRPGAVGVLDPRRPMISAPVGKSGPLMIAHEGLEQLLAPGLGVREVPLGPLGDLAQVVRRDLGGHADRDAGRAPLTSRLGKRLGSTTGSQRLAVVVGLEVDGLLVDVAHHLHGQRRHPALGVAQGGGAVVAREPKLPWPSTSG